MFLRSSPLLEKVPLSGPASVAIREFRLPSFTYPWHQHPEIEITWILKGSGLRYVGQSVEPFREGDFCMLGPNLPHAWLSHHQSRGSVRSLVIQFDPFRWGKSFLDLPEFAKVTDLIERSSRGLCFNPGIADRLLVRMSRETSHLKRFACLLELLEELVGDSNARPIAFTPWGRNRRASSDPRIRMLLTFLSKNIEAGVAHKDAARLVRLSPAAFSRFFRRMMGKTFSTYCRELRLSDACRRLLDTDEGISQIAYGVGFENLSTFNRAFRKERGMSPRLFRQQALETLMAPG